MHGAVLGANGKVTRQEFLDGDRLVQVGIVGQISDAEPALAEDRVDLVPVQAIAFREGVVVSGRAHGRCRD